MGDGFIVAQSNHLDIYYYQDEPGKVPVTTSADSGLATNSTLFFCALFVEKSFVYRLESKLIPLIGKKFSYGPPSNSLVFNLTMGFLS